MNKREIEIGKELIENQEGDVKIYGSDKKTLVWPSDLRSINELNLQILWFFFKEVITLYSIWISSLLWMKSNMCMYLSHSGSEKEAILAVSKEEKHSELSKEVGKV